MASEWSHRRGGGGRTGGPLQPQEISPGKRTLTEMAYPPAPPSVQTIRALDLDATRDLTDEQVAADAAELDRRLATATDPSERKTLRKGRQALEWLQHERGTARPFEAPDERYQRLPATPVEMRQYLEPLVARRGLSKVREYLYNVAFSNDMEPQNQPYELGLQQLQRIESDMQAFRAEFRPAARPSGRRHPR
jgi:hypothetical protein